MRANTRRRFPVLIELEGQVIPSVMVASAAEDPADIAIKVREHGWVPFRVRFDNPKAAWIVSTLR